jgi:uncharacterized iron-regulated membrane protein
MASRQALRKAWWQVHKWGGLVLMIALIPLGLSGVVLAWDDAIDHQLNPQRFAVSGPPALTPSAYAAAALPRLGPGEHVTAVRYPDGEGPVVVIAMKTGGGKDAAAEPAKAPEGAGGEHHGGRHKGEGKQGAAGGGGRQRVMLWLDPANGRVLDMARGDTGLVRIAHNIHGSMLVPGYGRAIVGLLGVAMFLMAASGVWLWWPPIGSWLKGLRWQRGDRRLDTNLHHRVGFWIALPLAFQAFTGVWIAWPQMLVAVGLGSPPGAAQAGPMGRAQMASVHDPKLTPEQALAAAEGVRKGAPGAISWPAGDKAQWRVSVTDAAGSVDVNVDDASGVAKISPPRGGALSMLVRHIHDGSAIGWGWRALMVLWGLAPTLLGITGLLMWLRGRRWRAQAAARKGKTREPVAAG